MNLSKQKHLTLNQFAEKYCDGLYDSRFKDSEQCSGWKKLKELVARGTEINDNDLFMFHPNLRPYLKDNWGIIKQLKEEQ